jgi:pantoate--beta-alanine ligase
MSSRNLRLSSSERANALSISRAIRFVQENVGLLSINEAKNEAKNIISQAGLKLDYLEIVDPLSLKNLSNWQAQQICCVAAFCGEVRLIDNMLCESVKLT